MIVVFDSNVWISALHFRGLPLIAIQQGFSTESIACYDEIVAEVRRLLVEKFSWTEFRVEDDLDRLLANSHKVKVTGSIRGVCRDFKDDMVLECAILAGAEIIVSGDRDLLTLGAYKHIRIVKVRDYIDILSQL